VVEQRFYSLVGGEKKDSRVKLKECGKTLGETYKAARSNPLLFSTEGFKLETAARHGTRG